MGLNWLRWWKWGLHFAVSKVIEAYSIQWTTYIVFWIVSKSDWGSGVWCFLLQGCRILVNLWYYHIFLVATFALLCFNVAMLCLIFGLLLCLSLWGQACSFLVAALLCFNSALLYMYSAAAIWDQRIALSLLLHIGLFPIVWMMFWCAVLEVCCWIGGSYWRSVAGLVVIVGLLL